MSELFGICPPASRVAARAFARAPETFLVKKLTHPSLQHRFGVASRPPARRLSEGSVLNGNRVNAIRARALRGWSVRRIARVLGVSRNTVRRYTRPWAKSYASPSKTKLDIRQELELVRRLALRWGRRDPDELESELTSKLVDIYPQKHAVDNWRGFLITALKRAASNWLRACRRRERHVASEDRLAPEAGLGEANSDLLAVDVKRDGRLLHERIRRVLPRSLLSVWDALIAEQFDQTRTARRLGVHRNTIHRTIGKIRRLLVQHDF